MGLMSMQGSEGRKSFPSTWALIAIASAVLMGCSKEKQPEVSAQNQSSAAAAANVVMPPAVVASHTYRCKDNSIVTADFFADGTTMLLREGSAPSPTKLTSAATGMPFIGDNESVTVRGVSLTIEGRDRPVRVCNRD